MTNSTAKATGRRRIYQKRNMLRRWIAEREEFQNELDEKLAYVSKHGFWLGAGTVEYPKARIEALTKQIAELSKEDLRTAEEKRGYIRAPYVRKKDIEFRGVPDEKVKEIEKRIARDHAERVRYQEDYDAKAAIPGSTERQEDYERRRWFLREELKFHGRARTLLARQHVRERRGEEIRLESQEQEALDKFIELLARLTDLDNEYSDCDTSFLQPTFNRGMAGDSEETLPTPYDPPE